MFKFSRAARWLLTCAAVLAVLSLFGTRTALAGGVVGNGTPGSCTETAFDNKLAGGATVTFNCGPNHVTITLTTIKNITLSTVIDGGNKITLSASNTSHFQVYAGQTLTLRNLTLSNGLGNSAGSIENLGTLIIRHVTFFKNKSKDQGGAITNYGELSIKNSTFTQNRAKNMGGAISNNGGNTVLKSSTLNNNWIISATGSGGAVANKAGDVIIKTSVLKGNSAGEGGAVWTEVDSTNTISRTTIDSNKGGNGAGVEVFGGMQIVLSIISNNVATFQGGGIYNGGSLSVERSWVTRNKAVTGGGMHDTGDSMYIEDSTFSANQATSDAGGVYSNAHPGIRNSTFSGNFTGPGKTGGAFYADGGDVSFEYVTIANNSASLGGGVYSEGSTNTTVYFQNTVLSNNLGGNCEGAEFLSGGHNLSSDTFCGSAFTEQGDKNNINAKLGPLAKNGGPTQTHLPLAGSPLINKGYTDNHIDHDQRRFPRPVGSSADIGAVEVQ